jgi:hypothetical protein
MSPPDISPEDPTNSPIRSGLSLTLASTNAAVMIKLNVIINIDKKYNKTIKLWLDLYQEKNKQDNHTKKAVAVP